MQVLDHLLSLLLMCFLLCLVTSFKAGYLPVCVFLFVVYLCKFLLSLSFCVFENEKQALIVWTDFFFLLLDQTIPDLI